MNAKKWLIIFSTVVAILFLCIGADVVYIDPYFHYHKPRTEKYYYPLNAVRYMNDGIAKNFEYSAMITGTSMTENFKTSEFESLFGYKAIKVPYAGGKYEAINEIVETGLNHNPNLKIVLRCLDMVFFLDDNKAMFQVAENYPCYLFDQNVWNDYRYLFNRDVVWGRVAMMKIGALNHTAKPGIESFDEYVNWMKVKTEFGKDAIYKECDLEKKFGQNRESNLLTKEEKQYIIDNIQNNVTNLCDQYPEVQFYYFFSPYSVAWWQLLIEDGTIERQLEAEKIIIEELIRHPNIELFSFNLFKDTTCNLDNYADKVHYGEWVNSNILRWIKENKGRITSDNYLDYLYKEKMLYSEFDYYQLLK